MPKVSVIVPVYNVERYLGGCLDPVLEQKLRKVDPHDIEVRFISIEAEGCEADYGTRTGIWSKASIGHIVHSRVADVTSMAIHNKMPCG